MIINNRPGYLILKKGAITRAKDFTNRSHVDEAISENCDMDIVRQVFANLIAAVNSEEPDAEKHGEHTVIGYTFARDVMFAHMASILAIPFATTGSRTDYQWTHDLLRKCMNERLQEVDDGE